MRNIGMPGMLVTLFLCAATALGAAPQTNCPITGMKVDKSIHADYEGKRVYFCSLTCPAEFAKGPARYVKQMEDNGVTLEKRQTLCPIEGGKINKDLFADYEGKRVYFCCAGCPETFKKDPVKYIKEMEANGITLDRIQTTCPVMGNKINKDIYADYDGKRAYFCCQGCPAEFKKDPAKYIKKLEADGITLDKAPASQGAQPSGVLKDGVRQVDYDAFKFGFSPDPLIVKAGERVRLQATSRDVPHGFMVAEISLDAPISPGPRKAIEFTAPAKPGKYSIKCSIFCGAGHAEMKGVLEVLPATP